MDYKLYEYSILELKKSLRDMEDTVQWYLDHKAPDGVISSAHIRITDFKEGINQLEKLQRAPGQACY